MKKNVQKASEYFGSKDFLSKQAEANTALGKFGKMLTEGETSVSKKNLGKAAVVMAQLEAATEEAGGYASGVGAVGTPQGGIGLGGFIPTMSQPIFKRVLTESTFVGNIVEFQPMKSITQSVFGVRIMRGKVGAEGVNDVNNELGRPMNNFVQAGGLKLFFDATAVAESVASEGDGYGDVTAVRLVDGSFTATSVQGGDAAAGYTLTNIEPNNVTTTLIEGTPIQWNYVEIVATIVASINAEGQWNAALTKDFRSRFLRGDFNTENEAEIIIKALATSGIGIDPQYALGLGEYGKDVDPNRDVEDLATETFTGALGADSKFMEVTPRVEHKSLEAVERVGKSTLLRNLQEDVARSMGIDYQELIIDQLKKIIIESMDLEILQQVKATSLDTVNGGAKAKVFNMSGSGASDAQGMWLQQKITSLITALVERGENIHKATGRIGRGDFGVVTPLTSAILISGGSLYNNFDIKDERATNSSKLGNIAGFEMHSDIWGEINDLSDGTFKGYAQMLVGLKSKGPGESGVIVGTYRPIEVSGPVVDAQDHNKTILVTTRYGISSNVMDSGSFYRTVLVKGASEAIYGA